MPPLQMINVWLNNLNDTFHFESVMNDASHVFKRFMYYNTVQCLSVH